MSCKKTISATISSSTASSTTSTTKRALCNNCSYPVAVCVCEAIAPIHSALKIDILQHPSEVKNAKNSARLIPLCIKNCTLWQGEQEKDFDVLQKSIQRDGTTWVIYPNKDAISLLEIGSNYSVPAPLSHQTIEQPKRLILLDGTWKKAYKLWQLNTWLHTLPTLRIDNVESQYRIRKAPKAGYLSTLEAVAICLEALEKSDAKPLYDCFNLMQKTFIQHQKKSFG